MRIQSRAPRANSVQPPQRTGETGRLAALCGLLFMLTLLAPTAALADSMALSIAPEPVANLTSAVTYTASSEEGTLAVVAANNPGVPCAADPAADDGQTITPGHIFESGSTGPYSGSINYTPPSTGAYTLCGWLEIPAGLIETDGGPVTAAASLPINVRAPRISLALSFPRRPQPGHTFTLDLTASSEVQREVVVEGIPLTRRGCPVNYAAEEADHLIDKNVTGGPWLITDNIERLRAGNYIFCAWADPTSDDGLYPEATTSTVLRLGKPPAPNRRKPAPRQRRRSRR
jgi:hypothetical protein